MAYDQLVANNWIEFNQVDKQVGITCMTTVNI